MKNIYRALAMSITVMAIGIAAPTDTLAQTAGRCDCVVSPGPNGQPIGSITGASGQVQVSQAAGFAAGGAGMSLLPGTQIIVGPQSSASISLGASCNLQIQQNSNVLLEALNGDICVRVSDFAGETAGNTVAVVALGRATHVSGFAGGIAGSPGKTVAVVVLGGAALGGIIALAVSDSDSVSD